MNTEIIYNKSSKRDLTDLFLIGLIEWLDTKTCLMSLHFYINKSL